LSADDFANLQPLDEGRFGTVYRATRKYLDQTWAVKLIEIERLSDVDRLLEEANKLASLPQHPNVVEVRAAGRWDNDNVYIAMNYCPGGSLATMAAKGPLDPARACQYVSQTCSGLDHVHEHELLHLDVRPANILIGSNRKAQLVDFGLALWFSDPAVETFYGPHAAPELFETGVGDRPADVYAAAMTLAHLLTGGEICEQWPGDSIAAAEAVANGDWPAYASLGPNVPRRLAKVIRGATSNDENERPQTARDLKAAIDRATPAISFVPCGDDEWRSADKQWRVTTMPKRGGRTVELLHNDRRQNKYKKEELTSAQATKHAANLMNGLAYPGK
jgi:serine/threonine protein kinase